MSKYAALMGARRPVPQSEPLDERQVQNNAGGYVFQLDIWKRLERFLILGSDSNTYYQSAKELTKQNANCVTQCWECDPMRALATIGLVSTSGRAPKNDPAIFALALGAVSLNPVHRQSAYAGVNKVCRTATHLFMFIKFVQALTGKSHFRRGLKNAVRSWYATKELDQCAFQMIKYREREGFSHERLMKACHPGIAVVDDETAARAALYRWARGLPPADEKQSLLLPNQVKAHLWALHPDKAPEDKRDVVELIKEYRLPWEAIRTEDLNKPDVWRAMLPNMGLTAMIRELARMTQIGLLKDGEPEVKIVRERLMDAFELRKARIHPFNLLLSGLTYGSGKSVKGSRTWTPVGRIKEALEEAFYMSFQYVQPSGKRHLVCLDISGSMSGPLMGGPLTCAQGSAALAMTTIRSEEEWSVMGFSTNFIDLGLTGKMSLEEVVLRVSNRTFGGTDCSLPMQWALQQKQKVDVFTVITDNETWAGREHPVNALRKYRDKMRIDAKLIVVGMTATNFTIADPEDAGMLDIVGFDSAAPALMADFAR
jgi:60 kDa SS-A/Ro ribonucleoprotein